MSLEKISINENNLEVCIKESSITDVKFGKNCVVTLPVNIYGCKIGDNTRVQSQSFICQLVSIGNNCFISPGVTFTNDTFSELGRPAYTEREYWKPTYIGNNVIIGSNATILPVEIADYTVIGAGSVVTKDITKPGIYAGNPARLLRNIPEKI